MTDKPSHYDAAAGTECYIDEDNQMIHVIVPSDIWINADQAEAFGKALLECAEWLRINQQIARS